MSNHLFDAIRTGIVADAPFVETTDGRAWTYGDMLATSARFANVLTGLGVQPGDRVAVQVEKSPEALMLYLACVRAGAVLLPLNTDYKTAELDYFIGDAEPKVLVCTIAREAEFHALAERHGAVRVLTLGADGHAGSLLTEAAEQPAAFEDVERDQTDPAAILYTSGTTGRSKGALLSHGNLASNARTLTDYWGFTDKDVLLHALPIFHTHGLFVATNVVLAAGASMIFLPKFDAGEIVRLLPRATSLMGVPTFYVRLLQHPGLSAETTRHIRVFISGSAPLLAETHRAWSARTGHAILERYGMTETNMNTSNPYEGERIPGTVGFPLPGVDLRIADPESG